MSLWITEAEVVRLIDMKGAIAALDRGLALEAAGKAENMVKTHAIWGGHHTLHAIGATFPDEGFVGTKTWAHANGAAPLLILFDSHNGSLQRDHRGLRARAAAHRRHQRPGDEISGGGRCARDGADRHRQAGLTQLAAVAAVRPLRRVRAFSRDAAARAQFVARARSALGLDVVEAASAAEPSKGAAIVTLVTRATAPVITSSMLAPGTHVNAVGAISPERTEFEPALLDRCAAVVADSVPQVKNSIERAHCLLRRRPVEMARSAPAVRVVAEGKGRAPGADLTLFKAMGMGISDLSLGIEILRRAGEQRLGREFPHPQPAKLFA